MSVVEIAPSFHIDSRLVEAGYDDRISFYNLPADRAPTKQCLFYSIDNPHAAVILGSSPMLQAFVDPDMMSAADLLANLDRSRPQDTATSAHHLCLTITDGDAHPPSGLWRRWVTLLDPATPAVVASVERLSRIFEPAHRRRPEMLTATGTIIRWPATAGPNRRVWADEDGVPFGISYDGGHLRIGARLRFHKATGWHNADDANLNLYHPGWLRQMIADSFLSIPALSL